MEGKEPTLSPRDLLDTSLVYQAFIKRISTSSERTQDHPLLHAVHQVRPAAVKVLLELCCSPSVRGTVHPYSGDDFSVADLQCVSPIELAKAYYPKMQMQSAAKAKRLKMILDHLLENAIKGADQVPALPLVIHAPAEANITLMPGYKKSSRKNARPLQLKHARSAWSQSAQRVADVRARPVAITAAKSLKRADQPQPRTVTDVLEANAYDSSSTSGCSSVSSATSSDSLQRKKAHVGRPSASARFSSSPQNRERRNRKVHKRLRRLVNDNDPLEDQNPEYAINLQSSSSDDAASSTEESDSGDEIERILSDLPAATIVRKHARMPGGVKLRAMQEDGARARYVYSERLPERKAQKARAAGSRPGAPRMHASESKGSKLDHGTKHAGSHSTTPSSARPKPHPPTTLRKMPLFGSERRLSSAKGRVVALKSFTEFADAMVPSIFDEHGMRRIMGELPAAGSKRPRLPHELQPRASLISRNFLAHQYSEYTRLVNRIHQLQRWENLLVTKPYAPVDVKARLQLLTRSVDSLFAQNVSSVAMMLAHAPRQSSSVGTRIAEQLALPVAAMRAAPVHHDTHGSGLPEVSVDTVAHHLRAIATQCFAGGSKHADMLCPTIPCVSVAPPVQLDDAEDHSTVDDEPDLQNTLQMDVPADVLELHTRVHCFPQCGSGDLRVVLDPPWKIHIGEASPINLTVAVVNLQADSEVDSRACEPLPMLVVDAAEDDTLIRAMLTLEGTSNPVEAMQELISGLVAMSIADLEHLELQCATQHFDIERFHPATYNAWDDEAVATLRVITRSIMHSLEFTVGCASQKVEMLHALLEGMKSLLTVKEACGSHVRVVMPCLSTSPCTIGAPIAAERSVSSYVLSAFCTVCWYLMDALSLVGTLPNVTEGTRSIARDCLRAVLAAILQLLHDFPTSFALDCLRDCTADASDSPLHVHAPVLSVFCKLHAFWASFVESLQVKSMLQEAIHLVSERPSWTRAFSFSGGRDLLWQPFHRWEMIWQLCGVCQIVERFQIDTTDEISLLPDPLQAQSGVCSTEPTEHICMLRCWLAQRFGEEFGADLGKLECDMDVAVCAVTAAQARKQAQACEQRIARVLLRLSEGFQLQFCVLDASPGCPQQVYLHTTKNALLTSQRWFRRMLLVLESVSAADSCRQLMDCVHTVGELQRKVSSIIRGLPDTISESSDSTLRESTHSGVIDMVPCRPVRLSTIISTWLWITSPSQASASSIQRPRSIAYLPEWIMRTVVCGDWNSFRVLTAVFRPLDLSLPPHKNVVFQLEHVQELSTSLLHDMIVFMLSASEGAVASAEMRTVTKRTLNRSVDGARKQQIICAASSNLPSSYWLQTLVSPPPKRVQSQVSSHFSSRPWLLFRLLGTLASTGLDAGESVVTSVQRSISTFIDMQLSDSVSRGLIVQAAWAASMFIRKNHRGFGSVLDFFCDVTTAALEGALFDFESRSLFVPKADAMSVADSRVRAMHLAAGRLKGFSARINFQGYQNDLSVIQLVADATACLVDHELCSGEICMKWLSAARKIEGLRVTQYAPYTVENVSRELCPVYCVRAIFQLSAKPAWIHFVHDADLQAQLTNSADVCLMSGIRLLERILSAGATVLSAAVASASTTIAAFPEDEKDEALFCAVEAVFPAAKSYPQLIEASSCCLAQIAGGKLHGACAATGAVSDLEHLLCTQTKAWLHAVQGDKYEDTCSILRDACSELFLPPVWSAPHRAGQFLGNGEDAVMASDSSVTLIISLLRCVLRCMLLQMEVVAFRGDVKAIKDIFMLFFSKFAVPPPGNATASGSSSSTSLWQRCGVLDLTRTSYRLIAQQMWPALCAAFLDSLSSHPVFSASLISMASDLPAPPGCIWETLRSCSVFDCHRGFSTAAIQRAVYDSDGLIQSIVLSTWLSAVPCIATQRSAPSVSLLQALGRGVCWLRSIAAGPSTNILPSSCKHLLHAWPASFAIDMSWARAQQLTDHVLQYVCSHEWDPNWRVAESRAIATT
jgi:hypothetical protein